MHVYTGSREDVASVRLVLVHYLFVVSSQFFFLILVLFHVKFFIFIFNLNLLLLFNLNNVKNI